MRNARRVHTTDDTTVHIMTYEDSSNAQLLLSGLRPGGDLYDIPSMTIARILQHAKIYPSLSTLLASLRAEAD